LRLYDFVFKNTKLGEINHKTLLQAEPNCGAPIAEAQVIEDKMSKIWYEPENDQVYVGTESDECSVLKGQKDLEQD